MPKEQEDQGFSVKDKRLFSEDGKLREEVAEETKKEKEEQSRTAAPAQETPGMGPPIDFPSYVLTYYTQGLVLLGEVPNPYTNKTEENLEAARHTIDILTLLQEKTRGNLDREEQQLLDSVLYELRMKFMAKTDLIKL